MYRGEAAELMAAAAGQAPPRPPVGAPLPGAAPSVRPELRRPLPYPEPVGLNDNAEDEFSDPAPRSERRRLSFAQRAARLVLAPLYIAVALGAVGIIALFVLALFNSPAG